MPGFSNDRFYRPFERDLGRLDPSADGWDTEAFSDQALEQLKKLGEFIVGGQKAGIELDQILAREFTCQPLRPPKLIRAFKDGCLTVWRGESTATGADTPIAHQGEAGLTRALADLVAPLAGVRLHVHFKMFRVQPSDQRVTTSAYFQLGGPSTDGGVHVSAVWDCDWMRAADGAPPRLVAIRLSDFEQVTSKGTGSPSARFTDATAGVLGKTRAFPQQLTRDLDYWGSTLDRRLGLDIVGIHGLAVGDVDGDGLEDIYVCEPGGLPNRLLLHKPDGTLRDVSRVAGVDFLEPTRSALLLDLDNDGDQDLVIASDRFIIFMSNDGYGRFQQRVGFRSTASLVSMAAADYDRDGDLDVYVCGYFTMEDATEAVMGLGNPIPFHDANNGARNLMFRNEGNWSFVDVTDQIGLEVNNKRFSLAAAWEDYDNDGDPDLYVANDYGRNCLYRNDDGRFVDVAAAAGVEDISSGMSASWGDVNRDGLPDIYVSNMFSSAGNRIAYQRKFKSDADPEVVNEFRRFARGNTLFQNAGDGSFRDISVPAGVTMGRWAWASDFVDINNDGWEDLIVANGMLTRESETGDL